VLGFIPGVGAIYTGQYLKGLIHILIFGGLVALLSQGPGPAAATILGLSLAGFIVYMIVDAHRTAKAKAAGLAVADGWGGGSVAAGRLPTGPIVLIGIGIFFLLQTLGVFENLSRYFFPLILIILGVVLLLRRMSPGGQ
jgi:hypothetical protein